jgi:hypothetical protein
MKILLKILASVALTGTILPSFFVFYGLLDLDDCKTIMAIAAILWLLTASVLSTGGPEEVKQKIT